MKLKCKTDWGEGSQVYVWMTSADYYRMTEIEGVGSVELIYVGGLLKIGGDSLLPSVWRSVVDGLTGKGNSVRFLCSHGGYLTARELPWEQNGLPPIVNIT